MSAATKLRAVRVGADSVLVLGTDVIVDAVGELPAGTTGWQGSFPGHFVRRSGQWVDRGYQNVPKDARRGVLFAGVKAPRRIQRRRTAGWRMPEGAAYVGRPSRWGNPFRVGGQIILTGKRAGERTTAADVVEMFRHAAMRPHNAEARDQVRAHLAGRDLVCWCPIDQPCHADVLLEIANGGAS